MSPDSLGMSNYSRTNLQPTDGFLKKLGIKILRMEIIEICEFVFPTFRDPNLYKSVNPERH